MYCFVLFFKIFLMWTIFKVCIEFVTVLLLFYFLFLWPWDMWDLSSLTRYWTHTPCVGRWSLNHGTAREVPLCLFLIYISLLKMWTKKLFLHRMKMFLQLWMGHFVYKRMNKGCLVKQRSTGSPNMPTGTFWHKPILSFHHCLFDRKEAFIFFKVCDLGR